MQRLIFDTEHTMFRDAFAAFLKKEVVPYQDEWEAARITPRCLKSKRFAAVLEAVRLAGRRSSR